MFHTPSHSIYDNVARYFSGFTTPRHAAHTRPDQARTTFFRDYWQPLCKRGLLRDYSPAAGGYTKVAGAALAIARNCADPGLAAMWLGQLLKVGLLQSYAGPEWQPAITDILDGRSLCALAISEPGVGAHPKHMKCTARLENGEYIIDGDKAYVSDGPFADWFIVLAITGQHGKLKQYSALLAHSAQNGLRISGVSHQRALGPGGHCNLELNNCRLPHSALLGDPGNADITISRTLRTLEDALLLAPIAGALFAAADALSASVDQASLEESVGQILCHAESVAQLGILSAKLLDQSTPTPDLTPFIVGARSLVSEALDLLEPWLADACQLDDLIQAIKTLNGIGAGATRARVNTLAHNYLSQR